MMRDIDYCIEQGHYWKNRPRQGEALVNFPRQDLASSWHIRKQRLALHRCSRYGDIKWQLQQRKQN